MSTQSVVLFYHVRDRWVLLVVEEITESCGSPLGLPRIINLAALDHLFIANLKKHWE